MFFGTIILCTLFGSSSVVFSNKFQDILTQETLTEIKQKHTDNLT